MKRRHLVLLVLVVLGSGATAFYAGRLVTTTRQTGRYRARHEWLADAPARAVRAEQRFQQRTQQLADGVRSAQARLSTLLADPCSTGEQVLAQTDHVIASHAHLMKAVGKHLVALRDALPRQQQHRLMGTCADLLQRQVQRRYRWRRGAQGDSDGPGRGNGYGDGGRRQGWRGPGRGRGRQYRAGGYGGHGLAGRLDLTDEQAIVAHQRDPDFDEDCARLKNRLQQAHADLLDSLERVDVGDEGLLTQIDTMIEAHGGLERRVARHVVLLRPLLTPTQRDRLAGLCGGRGRYQRDSSATWPRDNMGEWTYRFLSWVVQ